MEPYYSPYMGSMPFWLTSNIDRSSYEAKPPKQQEIWSQLFLGAVKELKLNYHHPETIFFIINPYSGSLN